MRHRGEEGKDYSLTIKKNLMLGRQDVKIFFEEKCRSH